MDQALADLSRLAKQLSEDETSLKVKCLLKVTQTVIHTVTQAVHTSSDTSDG